MNHELVSYSQDYQRPYLMDDTANDGLFFEKDEFGNNPVYI